MTGMRRVTALIAEDEPVLATTLERMLRAAWPQLEIVEIVHDGESALEAIADKRPDVAFLDIRMPGLGGLEVAMRVHEREASPPAIVFVTAYDQYAVEAFEAAAVDYLLKPVGAERLANCVARLQRRFGEGADAGVAPSRRSGADGVDAELRALIAQLQQRLGGPGEGRPRLRFLRASIGDVVRQIPVHEVLCFEARDKYVAVTTRDTTALVRLSLSELLDDLDPEQFAQIHRSTVVRLDAIDTIRRDFAGRRWVHLREDLAGREIRLAVSRQYAARFRGM